MRRALQLLFLISWSFLFVTPGFSIAQTTLTSPVGGAVDVSLQPTFAWSSGSTTEQFQIATDSGFVSIVFDKSFTSNETSYTLTEAEKLANGTEYFWRVSLDGGTTWSNVSSFTTIAAVTITLNWPTDLSNIFMSDVYFTWSSWALGVNLKFNIQVTSKTSAGVPDWTQTPDFETTTTALYTSFSLLMGKTYYWRVVVLNADDNDEPITYSSVNKFTTVGGSATDVTLSYPFGGATVYNNPPTFYWYIMNSGANLTYDIQVDDDNAFGSPEVDVTNIPDLYYASTYSFAGGTTYFWRVRAVYKRGTSDESAGNWSTTEYFDVFNSTTVTAPILSYPTGGVTVYTTSPFVYWYLNSSSAGISFDVYYKESGAATFTKANAAAVTDFYYQLTGLTEGKTYEWYIEATDGSTTATSPTETFTIFATATGTTVATYPVSGETVYSFKPTLFWYLDGSFTGLTKYTVRWKVDANSSDWESDFSGTADIADLYQTYYSFPSDLEYGATYYWAVSAYDGSAYNGWSSGSFAVYGSSYLSPNLSYPVGGQTVYFTTVNLSWYLNGSSGGVQSYEVHYSADGFASDDVTVTPNPTVTTASVSGLTPGTTYSWKVRTYYGGTNYSGYSATETFTVDAGAAPVQPLIGGPNNVALQTSNATISWVLPVASESDLSYQLEIADDASFANSQIFDNLSQPFESIDNLNSGEHYWRVRSKTSDGNFSDYSQTAKFNISSVTNVDDDAVPEIFALEQNYPNPFNPSTTITYQLANDSHVTLEIYDVIGRKIAELVNRNQTAGKYQIIFSADEQTLTTGIYFYRLTAGNFTSVKKMILLK
ncbi:MAG: T9SS type A sorting domain-containing protein [Chlorobi bacterium]|nr:T9SS type A sorting domain-containing protein [Chlorobiota bacterium]